MTWAVLACGAIVVVTEPLTIALLRRLMVIDLPGHRSSHSVPTPRGGGAPIALGLLVATVLATALGSRQLPHAVPGASGEALAFGFAVAFFGVLGLIDDLRGLPASGRLVLQAAGSAFVAGMLAGRLDLPVPVLVVIAVAIMVWLAGFVNAFNFMDGVNGISGAHALIGGVAYACLGQWRHDAFMVTAGLAVAAAACAFLPWNAFRARVFLGDVGSYSLGAALALLAACAVLRGVPVEAAAGPVALYLADTAWTLLRRIRRGENWLEPHRTHVYQRWCDVGWSHQEVSLLTAGCTVLLCLLGTVSAVGAAPARLAADLAGVAVLVAYLRSPELMGRPRTERARHANPYSHALLPARDGCPAGPAIGARANVGRRRR
jgi:UDP-N-acetylmuramyl pentapeptide phosphotransferase/UDP-N-acetylglucosamine-1-phosphate transferase